MESLLKKKESIIEWLSLAWVNISQTLYAMDHKVSAASSEKREKKRERERERERERLCALETIIRSS